MNVVGDPAVVLYDSACVDDAILTDDRAGIDNDTWHHYCARSHARRRGDDSRSVKERRRQEATFAGKAEATCSSTVVADRYNKFVFAKSMKHSSPTHHRTPAKRQVRFRTVIIKQRETLVTARTLCIL